MTGRAAIDAVMRSTLEHDYRAVKLKYAGGEPLLRFPFILDLHSYAQLQAKRHGLELDGIVLSNGTLLTREMIDKMRKARLRIMLSLDGIGSIHDCQRYYPDGHGSFADVARAVKRAVEGGLVPDISITVSGLNIAGLSETVAWVLDHNLPFSLNFYRIHRESDCQSDLRLVEDRIIEGMLEAYRTIERNLPQYSLLASLVDRANLSVPHLHTCSAGQNYLVFDTQGRVAKCQMEMRQSVADCHDADPLKIVRGSRVGLQNLSVDEKIECRDCEWRYWCGGGCPLETFRVNGRYNVKSPNCNIYKTLYPEVIRLEGLRLSRYGEDAKKA